jgi:dTDP-4-dehydrorhamnose 3,5-epimerase
MFKRLSIPEVFVFTPERYRDERGYFVQTFNQALLAPMTGSLDWVQDNQSLSFRKNTIRGMHFQIPPFAQDKLVRCVRGQILDVAVDIRHGSPTFGRHVAACLTAEQGEQMFVPKGFAHGLATLADDCEVAYKVTNYYSQEHDRSIRWNDPELGIDWKIGAEAAILSAKDAIAPLLSQSPAYFQYRD